MKYFYSRNGNIDQIRKTKGNKVSNDFNDFSQILSHFYSDQRWTYGQKKELAKLLDVRNSIVHRGQDSTHEEKIAESIVRTLFFIHATAWTCFNEALFFNNYGPHKIGESNLWRSGAESFASDIAELYNADVYKCLGCNAHAAISAELMVLDETNGEEDLICFSCFSTINLSHEGKLIECYECWETAYYLDALNEQEEQLYIGKCIECDTKSPVRKCKQCGEFYHPSEKNEVKKNNNFFCSKECSDYYI
ncbi:hypothetical protein [Hafnia sp.]|uniref:hypothetical protein n=1 Tax=Hafnia sp. TaxID=1873498 RepID=UPI002FC58E36